MTINIVQLKLRIPICGRMRTEGHVPGGVLLEPSVSKLLCIQWCFGDTTVQEVWFRQLMSINYIHIKLQRDIKLQTGRQTSMLFFSVIIMKQLKLVFLGESSELRSLLSLSPSHSISLSPPLILSLSFLSFCPSLLCWTVAECLPTTTLKLGKLKVVRRQLLQR